MNFKRALFKKLLRVAQIAVPSNQAIYNYASSWRRKNAGISK